MCCTDQCDPIGLQQALMASFSLPVPRPGQPLPPLHSKPQTLPGTAHPSAGRDGRADRPPGNRTSWCTYAASSVTNRATRHRVLSSRLSDIHDIYRICPIHAVHPPSAVHDHIGWQEGPAPEDDAVAGEAVDIACVDEHMRQEGGISRRGGPCGSYKSYC